MNSYKIYVRSLRKFLKTKKQKYYVNCFNTLGTDTNRNWKLSNSVLGRSSSKVLSHLEVDGTEVTDTKHICEKLNSHFTLNPKSIQDSIPST